MALKNQNGFTLIELILFLALSALFVSIALTGIRGRTAAVQRTDAVRSFISFIENERSGIYNGVNTSGTGDSGDTIVLGRTFVMNPGSSDVQVHTIIGDRRDFDAAGDDIREWLAAANPRSVGNPETYQMEWGTTFIEGFNIDDKIEMFSLMRNPNGQGLVSLAYSEGSALGDPWMPGAVSIHLCLRSADGVVSEVTVGSGRRDIGVDALFDDDMEHCNG